MSDSDNVHYVYRLEDVYYSDRIFHPEILVERKDGLYVYNGDTCIQSHFLAELCGRDLTCREANIMKSRLQQVADVQDA